jgi:hypothetical protein
MKTAFEGSMAGLEMFHNGFKSRGVHWEIVEEK